MAKRQHIHSALARVPLSSFEPSSCMWLGTMWTWMHSQVPQLVF